MKKIVLTFAVAMALVACEKETHFIKPLNPDAFKYVPKQELVVSSTLNIASRGFTGWHLGDTVGIFSDAKNSSVLNLPYVSTVTENRAPIGVTGDPYLSYVFPDGVTPVTGNTVLMPVNHNTQTIFASNVEQKMYAYIPYSAKSKDMHHVLMPNISVQQFAGSPYLISSAFKNTFAYTSATVPANSKELSFAPLKSCFTQITLWAPSISSSALGKYVKAVVVSVRSKTPVPVAYKDGATFDLATGKITGTAVDSVVLKMDKPYMVRCHFFNRYRQNPDYSDWTDDEIDNALKKYYSSMDATITPKYMALVLAIPLATAKTLTYNFTYIVGDENSDANDQRYSSYAANDPDRKDIGNNIAPKPGYVEVNGLVDDDE